MPNPYDPKVAYSAANLVGLALTDKIVLEVDDKNTTLTTNGSVCEQPYTEEQARTVATRALYLLITAAEAQEPKKWTPKVEAAFAQNHEERIMILTRALLSDEVNDNRKDAFELIYALSRKIPPVFTNQSTLNRWISIANATVDGVRDEVLPIHITDGLELLLAALEASRERFTTPKHYLVLPLWQQHQEVKDPDWRDAQLTHYLGRLEEFLNTQKELQRAQWQFELEEEVHSKHTAVTTEV